MALKKIEQVKDSKWFKIFDLICYAVVAAAIAVLFIVLALKKDNSALTGFNITYEGNVIYTYEFSSNAHEDTQYIKRDRITDGGFYLIFEDGGKRNEIFVNTKNKSVKVIESNCSRRKDCVYTAAVDKNGSLPIICDKHALIISPLVFEDNGVVVT